MAECKQKLTDLANRQGAYADLPEKIYWKLADNGEDILIYGLNHGDTDDQGSNLKEDGYAAKDWFVASKDGSNIITDDYIEGIYVKKPSLNYFWPIWQTFIDKSNGMLNNDGNLGQL